MNRIEIDVITGERKVIELTAEEIAQAQAMYAQWEIDEAKRKAELEITLEQQIAKLQEQIDALNGAE
jgi:predicted nucleotide-binding protein (sugar kinase/HSP70/actin superfamily)